MEVLYPRCCGLDVHKSSITACVLIAQSGKPMKHIRRFGCTTRELRELVLWLQEFGVEHVAMESTGVYWKPVWNVLESHFQIVLANAQHIKAVPGRKTDTKDCQWIADPYLRTLLVQGAQHILGPFGVDCDLRRWGLKLAERGGKSGKKRAIVATARKLAVLLHHLWVSGEAYEPLYNSHHKSVAIAA